MGFVVLMLAMAAHAMLETARDALFLSNLSAERLPIVYLVMGGLVVAASYLHERWFARLPRRAMLVSLLLIGAAGNGALWLLAAAPRAWLLGVLYVWTGTLATLVLLQFWLLASERFDVQGAKRNYSQITAGGVIGAALGAGLARLTLTHFPTRHLILGSAMLFLAAAMVVLRAAGRRPSVTAVSVRDPSKRTDSEDEQAAKDGYAWRIIGLAAALTIAATFADYQFKSQLQQAYSGAELAPFLASFGVGVNLLALAFQLLIAPLLLRKVGVGRSLRVLPGALLCSGLGSALLPGVAGAALLKGSDGSLRHGLHQAATEILFLPLSDAERGRIKTWVAAVGRRAAQAVGSVALLVAMPLVDVELAARVGCVILSAVALWLSVGLQREYVERFRACIRAGTLWGSTEAPLPDRNAIATLVQALDSKDPGETVAALDMLGDLGRSELVPPRLLRDPRPRVVLGAIRVLRRDPRPDVRERIRRLAEHDSAEVRAASLRHARATRFQTQIIKPHLSDSHADVRGAARVLTLVRRAGRGSARALRSLEHLSRSGGPAVRLAIAARITEIHPSGEIAQTLSRDDDRSVRVALAEGIRQGPRAEHLEALVQLLADRKARPSTRSALLELGGEAHVALTRAMRMQGLDPQIRLHLPRTLCRFPDPSVLDDLLDQLVRERDSAVSYKLLRALCSARNQHPEHALDPDLLQTCVRRELDSFRMATRALAALRQGVETSDLAAQQLTKLLAEQRERALLRVFRALHVWEPTEDFETLYEGLTHRDPSLRAASLEVVTNLVPAEWGEEIEQLMGEEPALGEALDVGQVLEELRRAPGVLGAFAREFARRASPPQLEPSPISEELAHVAE